MVGGEEAGMYNITQEKTVEVFADCQLFADNVFANTSSRIKPRQDLEANTF